MRPVYYNPLYVYRLAKERDKLWVFKKLNPENYIALKEQRIVFFLASKKGKRFLEAANACGDILDVLKDIKPKESVAEQVSTYAKKLFIFSLQEAELMVSGPRKDSWRAGDGIDKATNVVLDYFELKISPGLALELRDTLVSLYVNGYAHSDLNTLSYRGRENITKLGRLLYLASNALPEDPVLCDHALSVYRKFAPLTGKPRSGYESWHVSLLLDHFEFHIRQLEQRISAIQSSQTSSSTG